MTEPNTHLVDLLKDYLAITRSLWDSAQAGNLDRVYALIKDREELKGAIEEASRYTKLGKGETRAALSLFIATWEIESKTARLLEQIFDRERKTLLNLRGYAAHPRRNGFVNIST